MDHVFFHMALYTVSVRNVMGVSGAVTKENLPPGGGGGLGRAVNLGEEGGEDGVSVGGGGVGVAGEGGVGGAGDAGELRVDRGGGADGEGEGGRGGVQARGDSCS